MAQTPNLSLYYSFPGSLPHKSFVEQLSENMSKIDSAYSLISSALSSMASQIAGAYSVANEKATEDTFTTTVSTQGWTGSGDASLSAFTVGQTLNNGDKIHFDTTKGDELSVYLSGLTYDSAQYNLLLIESATEYLMAINLNDIGGRGYILTAYNHLALAEIDIIYATEAGSTDIGSWTAGFQNLDENGDYTIALQNERIISAINDTTPPTWNGVIIGTAGSATVTAPYTKTVALTGILATDNPVCDIVVSDTYATAEQELIDWSNIYKITTDDGSITLYAKEPPAGAMTIQLKVVR